MSDDNFKLVHFGSPQGSMYDPPEPWPTRDPVPTVPEPEPEDKEHAEDE
jgi:hypothetical protein